jgi:phenylalanyl-tRNA synthetase beta chain
VVDDYRGAGIDDGQKALTFALRFRADDRTLKAEEASEAKLAGVAAAELAFGAKLRE